MMLLLLETARSTATRWMMSVSVEDEEVEDGRNEVAVMQRKNFCLASLTKRSTLVVVGGEGVDAFRLLLDDIRRTCFRLSIGFRPS